MLTSTATMTAETITRPTSGEDLLRQAGDGDGAAFERLAREHRALLLRVARAVLRDRDAAEDAVQEALLAAYRGAATWSGRGSARAWLAVITLNAARMAARARAARAHHEAAAASAAAHAAATSDTTFDDTIWRHVDALPDDQRQALTLRYRAGLEVAEIAVAVGITRFGVHKRLSRGIATLRRALGVGATAAGIAAALGRPLDASEAVVAVPPPATALWWCVSTAAAAVAVATLLAVIHHREGIAMDDAARADAVPPPSASTPARRWPIIDASTRLIDLAPDDTRVLMAMPMPTSAAGLDVPWIAPALASRMRRVVVGVPAGEAMAWVLAEADEEVPWDDVAEQTVARSRAVGWQTESSGVTDVAMTCVTGSAHGTFSMQMGMTTTDPVTPFCQVATSFDASDPTAPVSHVAIVPLDAHRGLICTTPQVAGLLDAFAHPTRGDAARLLDTMPSAAVIRVACTGGAMTDWPACTSLCTWVIDDPTLACHMLAEHSDAASAERMRTAAQGWSDMALGYLNLRRREVAVSTDAALVDFVRDWSPRDADRARTAPTKMRGDMVGMFDDVIYMLQAAHVGGTGTTVEIDLSSDVLSAEHLVDGLIRSN